MTSSMCFDEIKNQAIEQEDMPESTPFNVDNLLSDCKEWSKRYDKLEHVHEQLVGKHQHLHLH